MIVTCPNCATRYIVDPQALGAMGRTVRCANCQNTWHQDAPADQPRSLDLAPPIDGPRPIPPGSNLPAMRSQPTRRGGLAIGWMLFLLVVFGGAIGAIAAKDDIVRLWPPSARFYELIGQPVRAAGEGLDLRNVTSTRKDEAGALIVEGTLVNVTDKPRQVPKLRAIMTSRERQVLKEWSFPSGVPVLMAGESAPFRAELPDVPRGGANLEVTFTE